MSDLSKLPCGEICTGEKGCGECNLSDLMVKKFSLEYQNTIDIIETREITTFSPDYNGKEIAIQNGKIINIVFMFNSKEYRTYFDYKFVNNEFIINNIKLQEKVKGEYSELKSVDILYRGGMYNFIEKVLIEYSNY